MCVFSTVVSNVWQRTGVHNCTSIKLCSFMNAGPPEPLHPESPSLQNLTRRSIEAHLESHVLCLYQAVPRHLTHVQTMMSESSLASLRVLTIALSLKDKKISSLSNYFFDKVNKLTPGTGNCIYRERRFCTRIRRQWFLQNVKGNKVTHCKWCITRHSLEVRVLDWATNWPTKSSPL